MQVPTNLIGDAIKFTASGGRVSVIVSPQEELVVFEVALRDQASRRGSCPTSSTATSRHNGLGLAIASGLIQAHHGRIWVESEAGKGTSFFFMLPRAEAPR